MMNTSNVLLLSTHNALERIIKGDRLYRKQLVIGKSVDKLLPKSRGQMQECKQKTQQCDCKARYD